MGLKTLLFLLVQWSARSGGAIIQRLPLHFGELRLAVGFCEQQHAFVEAAVMHDGVGGGAGVIGNQPGSFTVSP